MTPVLVELPFLFLLLTASSLAMDWPLMKCSRGDPNVNQCLFSAAKHAVTVITKGLPEIGVRPLEPMNMGGLKLSVSKGLIKLNVELKDAFIHGASHIQVNSAKYVPNNVISVEGVHKELSLTGSYQLRGKLFFIPVNSEGTLDIRLKDLRSNHNVDFHNSPNTDVGFKIITVGGLTITLNNPRAATATSTLSKLLNSNWEKLLKAFTPEIEHEVQRVYTEALRPLFDKFPPSTFFPQ